MTLPRSGGFANHSKSFIHFSYVICVFTYRIVELVVVEFIWFAPLSIVFSSGGEVSRANYFITPYRS
jgi:hypothetical protein